jgi:hypothetical protein
MPDQGRWIGNRSNLAQVGKHRVTVSYVNQTVSYPADLGEAMKANGKFIVVDHVWTGTVTANEVTFKVKADDEPKQGAGDKENAPGQTKKQEGGKEVKGLVALAELVEKPAEGLFEVRLSLKNVSSKAITICDCPYFYTQVQVQWIGPDRRMRTSKHHNYPPRKFPSDQGLFRGYCSGRGAPDHTYDSVSHFTRYARNRRFLAAEEAGLLG